MTNTPSSATPSPLCPLATDADGSPLELPDDAAAWRVRRHTRGRPRIQLGADKQPMQLPLSYTLADLDDILSPGVYRLDLVDEKGDFLGMTKQVIIGQPRNADADDDNGDVAKVHDEETSVSFSTMEASTVSDSRFALEASVRSTHLAFQHNQRTLELGLRMAETLRDGVRVLADAQADWIKSISSSRGFFRNAPALLPVPSEPPKRDQEDDDEDGRKRGMPFVHFHGAKKPFGLNSTNAKTISTLVGSENTDKWRDQWVELYVTKTTVGKDTVDCIRVKQEIPKPPAVQTREASP